MNVMIDGRGEYTLTLDNGNLVIALDGVIIMKTKGNPSKRGNPPFADIDAARAYFETTGYAQPIIEDMSEA